MAPASKRAARTIPLVLAMTFAVMTVFSSGISMYAMALLLNLILGWDFNVSVWLSAIIVLIYISLGPRRLQLPEDTKNAASLTAGYTWLRGQGIIMSRNVNVPTLTAAQAAAWARGSTSL